MSRVLVALDDSSGFTNSITHFAHGFYDSPEKQCFVGLLAQNIAYAEPRVSKLLVQEKKKNLLSPGDKQKVDALAGFRRSISEAGLSYEVHNNLSLDARGIINQSHFADLLMLSYQAGFQFVTEDQDSSVLYSILKEARCPVLLLPDDFQGIDNVVFAYDGKDSSIYAIREFTQLYGKRLRDKEVTILTIDPTAEAEIAHEKLILGYLQHHYSNVGVKRLTADDTSEEIYRFSSSLQNPVVVMGAYGRSHLSHLMAPSVAKNIIFKKSLPLFIAHR
ncbi:hypothetical protein FUAX_08180 [Fulvitalea axinellae]|uniref:Universal stress protein n=1 Tax=Fulvitalea axinellae TaxID=1182444 RepID=A0AAU9CHU2_9BACT|nr:hypothetical protein FUAX_08180 [Fulvitalea axinellae]